MFATERSGGVLGGVVHPKVDPLFLSYHSLIPTPFHYDTLLYLLGGVVHPKVVRPTHSSSLTTHFFRITTLHFICSFA